MTPLPELSTTRNASTQHLFYFLWLSPAPTQETEMQKQDPAIACSVAPSNQESKKPSMASQKGAAPPTQRSAAAHEIVLTDDSPAPEDFEFCVLSSGGLALAGEDAVGMCAADEVFAGGKLLPLRLSSATFSDASAVLLLRSDSLDGAAASTTSSSGFSSRSTSRSASSTSSSSSVSRSTSSSSSASSSDPAASLGSLSNKSAASFVDAVASRRRSTSSSVFYAHPSPSPCPPRRSGRSASVARRSTGSAPPASWGIIRLGVVGAPEVYPRRAPADSRKVAAARGGSQSARFEQATKEVNPVDNKKLGLGLFGAGLVCACSPDAVAPVGTAEAATAEARRRKKAEDKKRAAKQSSKQSTSRRSRILNWLEEHSKHRAKNGV